MKLLVLSLFTGAFFLSCDFMENAFFLSPFIREDKISENWTISIISESDSSMLFISQRDCYGYREFIFKNKETSHKFMGHGVLDSSGTYFFNFIPLKEDKELKVPYFIPMKIKETDSGYYISVMNFNTKKILSSIKKSDIHKMDNGQYYLIIMTLEDQYQLFQNNEIFDERFEKKSIEK